MWNPFLKAVIDKGTFLVWINHDVLWMLYRLRFQTWFRIWRAPCCFKDLQNSAWPLLFTTRNLRFTVKQWLHIVPPVTSSQLTPTLGPLSEWHPSPRTWIICVLWRRCYQNKNVAIWKLNCDVLVCIQIKFSSLLHALPFRYWFLYKHKSPHNPLQPCKLLEKSFWTI